MSADRVLVTGATGFVGSHLVRRLVERGTQVAIVTRPTSSAVQTHRLATAYQHDGTTEGMLEIMRDARPSVVYHLAATGIVQHAPSDVEAIVRSNVLLGTQLLEAMRAEHVTRFVNTGTYWQYDADGAFDPMCFYAATKEAFDCIATFYARAYGIRCLSLVLFDTYGPGDKRGKLLGALLRQADADAPLALSPGEQAIDLTYVEDVVDAYERAAELTDEMAPGEMAAYEVRTGTPTSIRALVDVIGGLRGAKPRVSWGARPYRDRERMAPTGPGVILPGWHARTTLGEGLRMTLAADGAA